MKWAHEHLAMHAMKLRSGEFSCKALSAELRAEPVKIQMVKRRVEKTNRLSPKANDHEGSAKPIIIQYYKQKVHT